MKKKKKDKPGQVDSDLYAEAIKNIIGRQKEGGLKMAQAVDQYMCAMVHCSHAMGADKKLFLRMAEDSWERMALARARVEQAEKEAGGATN